MTRERKVKLFIAIICLVLCLVEVSKTYAKYIESKQGSTDFAVAAWRILINDTDISSNAQLSSLIHPVYENNSNIASGVIAPSSEGYFDIEINATNTQVSFRYDISVTSADDTDVEDFVVNAYRLNEGAITSLQNGLSNLSGTVAHDAQNKMINLRIYFTWLEGANESMNNVADTAASLGGGSGKLNVSATFTQIPNS